jgi:hypothetical protein
MAVKPIDGTLDMQNLEYVDDVLRKNKLIETGSLAACAYGTTDALFNLKGIVDGDIK